MLAMQGRAIPDRLKPPPIFAGFEPWVEAFWELSTDRQIGFGGAGPIPSRAIADYARNMKPSEAEFFRVCVRAMDSVFLSDGQDDSALIVEEPEKGEPPKNAARDHFRAKFKKG